MKQIEILVNGVSYFQRDVLSLSGAEQIVNNFTDCAIIEGHLKFVYREYDDQFNILNEVEL